MPIEKLEVRNRFSGEVQFTAEIECAPHTLPGFKLGLAVRWGYSNKANLGGANLYGANLRAADLYGANLGGANLYGADLRGADLRGADLYGANLGGANLGGADLYGADLRGADLYGADLRGADLYGADLYGSDLYGANLGEEKIKRLLACASRVSGGYTFSLMQMEAGPAKVMAGCRFMTVAEYRGHVASEYPDTAKARETLRILDYFDATLAAECAQKAEAA